MARNNNRAPSIATLLLLYEIYKFANEAGIPPITLFTVGAQIMIFFKIIRVPWDGTSDICMSVDKIVNKGDYRRLFFGALDHGDDVHLYYNMISLMMKGKFLESFFKSGFYIMMLITLTIFTNITYLALNFLLSIFLMDHTFNYSCAVGFSGTLFAMKVVISYLEDLQSEYKEMSRVRKYGVWFELFYISLITPNVSFIGHLAGILVGSLFCYGPLRNMLRYPWVLR